MANQLNLDPETQLNLLQQRIEADPPDYQGAYDLVIGWMTGTAVDDETKVFFRFAREINANAATAASVYIRTVTRVGLQMTPGGDASEANINRISDALARNVFGQIIDAVGIPQFNDILREDVGSAIRDGGQTWGGWGGALFYLDRRIAPDPQDARSVAKMIFGTTAGEIAKFEESNIAAGRDVIRDYGFTPDFFPALSQAINAGYATVLGQGSDLVDQERKQAFVSLLKVGASVLLLSDAQEFRSRAVEMFANVLATSGGPIAEGNVTILAQGSSEVDVANANADVFNSIGGSLGINSIRVRAGTVSAMFGGGQDNHLAGLETDESIYGGSGDDWLGGMAGNDQLEGGDGKDVLLGGAGGDLLHGGSGVDVLNGGLGTDTYVWNAGDGDDVVIDAREVTGRKLGTILFQGESLTGEKTQLSANEPRTFQDPALAGVRYTLTGKPGGDANLKITRQGETGSLLIVGFQSEDFGIVIPTAASVAKTEEFGTENNDAAGGSTAPEQRYFGLGGNDRIIIAHANSEGYGGLGHDYITNDVGDQQLYGDEGNDMLVASAGFDELYGGADGDALQGGADDDYLQGDGGGDVLDGGLGDDVIYGGEGNDFIAGGGTLTVEGWDANNPPSFGTVTVNGVTGPSGISGFVAVDEDGADFIDGGAGIDSIFAGSGNDFARGGSENDLVVGLAGSDVLEGNDGADSLYSDATQGLITIGGQDFYTVAQFHGSDALYGGAGNDTLTGDGGADELYGEGDDDTLIGDATGLDESFHGADYLDGGAGNDTLLGYGKADTLFGGDGNDTLKGDSNTIAFDKHGDDYLDGGAGLDHVQGDGGSDTLFGGDGADQLFGDSDDTPLAYQGDDYLDGGAGDDYLRGYGGADTLFGGADADQLLGEAGDDYLDGEAGNDILSGGDGNDVLNGGTGNDTLFGGAGTDTYVFNSGDGQDTISNLDASTASTDKLVVRCGNHAARCARLTGRDAERWGSQEFKNDLELDSSWSEA